jgi:hypothetical protein
LRLMSGLWNLSGTWILVENHPHDGLGERLLCSYYFYEEL